MLLKELHCGKELQGKNSPKVQQKTLKPWKKDVTEFTHGNGLLSKQNASYGDREASINLLECHWGKAGCDRIRFPERKPYKAFYATVKLNPKLQWRPQDAGDARSTDHLPRKNCSHRMEPVGESGYVCCKQRRWTAVPRPDDAPHWHPHYRNEATRFGACPAGFPSWLVQIFSAMPRLLSFWNGNVYSIQLHTVFAIV